MKIKGTMERLLNHLDVLAELKGKNATMRPIIVLECFIKQDVLDLKAAVMTHALDQMAEKVETV